jgi:precorrin-2 methylase
VLRLVGLGLGPPDYLTLKAPLILRAVRILRASLALSAEATILSAATSAFTPQAKQEKVLCLRTILKDPHLGQDTIRYLSATA